MYYVQSLQKISLHQNPTTDCFYSVKNTRQQQHLPSFPKAWRLGFLAKKFLGFLTFLAKILAIILGKVRKILQDFSRWWKGIQENFWTSWQENQDYPVTQILLKCCFLKLLYKSSV